MSIYGAMYSGVSGLAAQSNALGMISDNISNVNTVGYKGTKAAFKTLVTESASRTAYTPGGVRSMPLAQIDRQGLLQASSSATDLAIAGNGFFVVNEAAQPEAGNQYMYTRAGNFRADADGNLANAAGYYLQGWRLNPDGTPVGNTSVLSSVETVNVANLSGTATATANVELGVNLPSTVLSTDTDNDRDVTVQVYDSLGNAHDITLTFTKSDDAAQTWTMTASNPVAAGTTTASGTTTLAASEISFDGSGLPDVMTLNNLNVTWNNGATASSIAIDGGTVGQSNGITQFAGDYTISYIDQDGVRFGQYTGVSIDESGVVTALFDNGERRPIYQLPVAMFSNPNGLEARDGNAYIQTDRSGDYVLGVANTGGAGKVAPSALEASTVDLAEEFTDMIVTQRAYSASAKIITTADEMLEELIRIRR
jgi:flagellar hook protein FlgE